MDEVLKVRLLFLLTLVSGGLIQIEKQAQHARDVIARTNTICEAAALDGLRLDDDHVREL